MAKVGRKRTLNVDRYPSGDIRPPKDAKNYVVYVIGSEGGGGPCKIGHTGKSDVRLSDIQTGHWDRLELYHQCFVVDRETACKVEKLAHKQLINKRIRGEWFDVGMREAAFVVEMAKEQITNKPLTSTQDCGSIQSMYTTRGVQNGR